MLFNMKNEQNTGFTLIELMITVAVLGVIMAIAIPTYQGYTIRSKITGLVTTATTGTLGFYEEYDANDAFPAAAPAAGTDIGDWLSAVQNSDYTVAAAPAYDRASVGTLTNNQAQVTVTLANIGGTADQTGTNTLIFYFTTNEMGVTVACDPTTTSTTVEGKYLPSQCRD